MKNRGNQDVEANRIVENILRETGATKTAFQQRSSTHQNTQRTGKTNSLKWSQYSTPDLPRLTKLVLCGKSVQNVRNPVSLFFSPFHGNLRAPGSRRPLGLEGPHPRNHSAPDR